MDIKSKTQSLTLLVGRKSEASKPCNTEAGGSLRRSAWCRQQAHWFLHNTFVDALASRSLNILPNS